MGKYHVTDEGPKPCSAKIKCPVGGDSIHFADKETAQKAFELSMASKKPMSGITKAKPTINSNTPTVDMEITSYMKNNNIEVNGHKVRLLDRWGPNKSKVTKTRIYPNFAPTEEVEKLVGFSYSDLKYTRKGEDLAMDAKWKKWNRAEVKLAKANALQKLEEAGFGSNLDISFSRTAGCGCGCSPGFIFKGGLLKVSGTNQQSRPLEAIF